MSKTKPIVVVGFPRSGNTWLTRLLAECLGCPSGGAYIDNYQEQAAEGLDRESKYSVFKTHHEYSFIAGNCSNQNNVIHIVRDIRDIVVSGWHYWDVLDAYSAYCHIQRGCSFGFCDWTPWNKFVREFLDTNIYMVKYEDLRTEPELELIKILTHLKIERTYEQIKLAIEAQSFEKRKKEFIEAKEDAKAHLMYRGEIGRHNEELSPELISLITRENYDTLKHLRYIC